MLTKAISHRTSEIDWMPATKFVGTFRGDSIYNGSELVWVKMLSDRRADGEGFAYMLKLCPPKGQMINLVAAARSDEHVWILEGGYCDRAGRQRAFPGDYTLNPEGHPHGGFCAVETVALVICTGEPDEMREFLVLDFPTSIAEPEDQPGSRLSSSIR